MLALLALTAAQPLPAPDLGPATIPLAEFRTLPDEAFARRVLGPLALFPLVSHRETDPGRLALRPEHVWFWSRPRVSDRPGVCFSQRLIVSFRSTGLRGANAAMQPTGVQLDSYYIIQDEAVARRDSGHPIEWRAHMAGPCSQIDPRQIGSTPAESGSQFMAAREMVEQLGEAAKAGRAPAPLDCSRMNWNSEPPADEAACLREMTWLHADSVYWVRNCWPRREAPGGCLQVQTARWFIEFDRAAGGNPIRIVVNGIEDTDAVE